MIKSDEESLIRLKRTVQILNDLNTRAWKWKNNNINAYTDTHRDTYIHTHTIQVYKCEQVREHEWASENDTKKNNGIGKVSESERKDGYNTEI